MTFALSKFICMRIACAAALLLFSCSECRADELLGLPSSSCAPANAHTETLVPLGSRLFADKRFSSDGTISCATCHEPQNALSDGRTVARGVRGMHGTRNTPSLWNVCYLTSQFWEGRRQTLEQQAKDPLLNPREHGVDITRVLAVVRGDPEYRTAFPAAFGVRLDQVDIEHVSRALAAFERTLVAGNAPFDRYLYGKKEDALSPAARRGFELFRGRAQCSSCHLIEAQHALFTDQQFHRLGVGWEVIAPDLPRLTTQVASMSVQALDRAISENARIAALGRFLITKDPQDIGKFKTPSLRNVALTAPYMHDGSVPQLGDAVDFELYYRGLESGVPLIVTPAEKSDLIEFLRALTSPTATDALPRIARPGHPARAARAAFP